MGSSAATSVHDWIELGLQVVMAAGVFFAAFQLRLGRLASLLQAEDSLADARARYVDANFELQRLEVQIDEYLDAEALEDAERVRAQADLQVAYIREVNAQFLNRLDRICASVRRREIKRKHAEEDYRGMIKEVCESNPEIRNGSPHTNISKLYGEWCEK